MEALNEPMIEAMRIQSPNQQEQQSNSKGRGGSDLARIDIRVHPAYSVSRVIMP
jgi:hypothetical protein